MKEFVRWFDPVIAGPKVGYTKIASEIWQLWQGYRLRSLPINAQPDIRTYPPVTHCRGLTCYSFAIPRSGSREDSAVVGRQVGSGKSVDIVLKEAETS